MLICAISFSLLGCSWHIRSSTRAFHVSGPSLRWSHTIRTTPLEPKLFTSDWSKKGWTTGQVTLLQAFGYRGQGFKFPSFNPQLPGQVSQSRQSSKGQSGATKGLGPSVKGGGNPAANRALGQKMVAQAGWTGSQWSAFDAIATEESGWYTTIHNGGGFGYIPGLAYGIPQALPGTKMASVGANWQTDPATQIQWMIDYIRSTYGTPQNALAFHQANGYY